MERPKPKWVYGVLAVPERFDDLLPKTLDSLDRAGFPKPWLFVDGMTPESWLACRGNLDLKVEGVTLRSPPAVRVAGNWICSLYEMYMRTPEAERYAIFQDDVLFCANLREYLDRCPYPDGPPNKNLPVPAGYWNLYSDPSNDKTTSDKPDGWCRSNQLGKGALALVFNRQATVALLGSYYLAQRGESPTRGWRAIDGGIVCALMKEGWVEYVHKPSLVLHTGRVSSMNHSHNTTGREKDYAKHEWNGAHAPELSSYRGESTDALSFLSAS